MQMLDKPPQDVIHAMRQLSNSPAWETLDKWLQQQREALMVASLLHTSPENEALMRQKQGAARLLSDLNSLRDMARS